MHHLFIDCETLSTHETAIIPMYVAIHIEDGGSVVDALKNHMFVCHPSMNEQKNNGRVADESTKVWWQKQNPKIFSTVMSQTHSISTDESAEQFRSFLNTEGLFRPGTDDSHDTYIWQRGSKDETWLNSLYEGKLALPWWRVRDVRTAVDVLGGSKRLDGNADPSVLCDEDIQLLKFLNEKGLDSHHPVFDVVRDITFLRSIGVIRV